MNPPASDPRAGENRRLLVRLGLCAVMMFGFGFLLVDQDPIAHCRTPTSEPTSVPRSQAVASRSGIGRA